MTQLLSSAHCIMTLYLLKVHLQMFLSIPITQKSQTLSCDTLVANERDIYIYIYTHTHTYIHTYIHIYRLYICVCVCVCVCVRVNENLWIEHSNLTRYSYNNLQKLPHSAIYIFLT